MRAAFRGIVVLLGFLAPLAVQADDVADSLRTALKLAASYAPDDAVDALPPDNRLTRDHVPLVFQAAEALRGARPDAALRLYVAANRLEPDNVMILRALERHWGSHPAPSVVPASAVPHLPVSEASCRLPAGLGGEALDIVILTPRNFLEIKPVTDPRTNARYSRVAGVYVRNGDTLVRRFVLHWVDGVPEECRNQVANTLAALDEVSRRWKTAWKPRDPFHVYLALSGQAGAEQWGDSITIHQAGIRRSPLEWVRQLSHEWGHASLRGTTGFREPEAWTNGDLGERLYLPVLERWGWLSRVAPGAEAGPYERRYVHPLREAFARTGPDREVLADTSRRGYDHFLGGCLYMADAYGLPTLLQILDATEGSQPLDVFIATRRVLSQRSRHQVFRPVDAPGPRPICIPANGVYILEGPGLRLHGKPATGPVSLKAGWILAEWTGPLTVRRSPGR